MIFPYEKFTINTVLPPHAVRDKLLEVVEPVQWVRWAWTRPEKPYQGEVLEDSFRISRVINYRNSFLPAISGKIRPRVSGSEILVEMKLNDFVWFFMLFWLIGVGVAGLVFLVAMIGEGEFELMGLIPVAMFIFGCCLPSIGFWMEAGKSKQFLIELLQR